MIKLSGYKIIKRIASGGMGDVYLAEHTILENRVAIKSLHSNLVNDEGFRKRFRKEAKTQSKLSHPNIVKLVDFQEKEDGLFLIMEYVEGKQLNDYISKVTGPIPDKDLFPLFIQILSAIKYAHSKKLIHRDIKPSNILITPEGTAKLIDFGIAKSGEEDIGLTKTGVQVGTVSYMSPEQVNAEKLDNLTDIYSLGVTLFQMAVGQAPYAITELSYKIQLSIVNDPLPNPKDIYPSISNKLVKIIEKATQKKKGDRYQNCEEFIKSFGGLYVDKTSKVKKSSLATVNIEMFDKKPASIIIKEPEIGIYASSYIFNAEKNKSYNVIVEREGFYKKELKIKNSIENKKEVVTLVKKNSNFKLLPLIITIIFSVLFYTYYDYSNTKITDLNGLIDDKSTLLTDLRSQTNIQNTKILSRTKTIDEQKKVIKSLNSKNSKLTKSISKVKASGDYVGQINFGKKFPNTDNKSVTPFSSYYSKSKHQYVIKASELIDKGARKGNIKALGFYISKNNDFYFKDFKIKMKNVPGYLFERFVRKELKIFYTQSIYRTPPGDNLNDFYEGDFYWDGSSNLVIQVEFSSDSFYKGSQKNIEVSYQKLSWKATNYLTTDTKNINSPPGGQSQDRPAMVLIFE